MMQRIAEQFLPEGFLISCMLFGQGRVNGTFLLRWNHGGSERKYILQRLSPSAFPDPDALMRNLERISAHLFSKQDEIKIPQYCRTITGSLLFRDGDAAAWRMMAYIDGVSHESCPDARTSFETGKGYGRFLRLLSDFDAAQLESIRQDFHHTRTYLERLTAHAASGMYSEIRQIQQELCEIAAMSDTACTICDDLTEGKLPLRAVHGDTKISNVVFEANTGLVKAVIDLDTVMAGSPLYDFGDAVRSIAFVQEGGHFSLDMNRYRAFYRGWLPETDSLLTSREHELLRLSVFTVTLELAVRYLDDWLTEGDYFRVPQERKLARAKELLSCCQACSGLV